MLPHNVKTDRKTSDTSDRLVLVNNLSESHDYRTLDYTSHEI